MDGFQSPTLAGFGAWGLLEGGEGGGRMEPEGPWGGGGEGRVCVSRQQGDVFGVRDGFEERFFLSCRRRRRSETMAAWRGGSVALFGGDQRGGCHG